MEVVCHRSVEDCSFSGNKRDILGHLSGCVVVVPGVDVAAIVGVCKDAV